MKSFRTAAVLAILIPALAACGDESATENSQPAQDTVVQPSEPAASSNAAEPANTEAPPASPSDTTSNQVVSPRPQSGSGGESQSNPIGAGEPAQPVAPAQ